MHERVSDIDDDVDAAVAPKGASSNELLRIELASKKAELAKSKSELAASRTAEANLKQQKERAEQDKDAAHAQVKLSLQAIVVFLTMASCRGLISLLRDRDLPCGLMRHSEDNESLRRHLTRTGDRRVRASFWGSHSAA